LSRFGKFFTVLPACALAWVTVVASSGRAQDSVAAPAPLSRKPPVAGKIAPAVTVAAAQRAQDLGLPSVAADLYRELRDAPGADRNALGLALATALLDAGDAEAAESVLAEMPEEQRSAGWRLRAGLAALQMGRRAEAQAHWNAMREPEVAAEDLAWYRFLTGALWDTATPRDVTRANAFYVQAEELAPTVMARARFQLAGERVRLRIFGQPQEADLRQARENARQLAGQAYGYEAAKNYAVMLAESGRRAEAVETLQRVLTTAPVQERAARDELRFVLGLIGDRTRPGAGRAALVQLLEGGFNVQRQRQALQLLAEASRQEPERGQFRTELNRLLAGRPAPALLEAARFFRAQLALAEGDFVRTEAEANLLLKDFPGSRLRIHAWTLLTQSAWEQRRYRLAADFARKARGEIAAVAPGEVRPGPALPGSRTVDTLVPARVLADLGVIEAEAWFRAGDHRSAADAYAAVLRERRSVMEPGRVAELMFQRVLAEIKAGPAEAGRVLDELAGDPAFDLENRWEAEWSLARALNLQGPAGVRLAFERITRLLSEPAGGTGIKPELRARMAWLQARLAFDSGNPAETLRLVDAQLGLPAEIDAALRIEIASILTLLKARSELALGREPAALETLKRLRDDYPRTDAAISSYLIESEYYAAQDKIDEARNRLIGLTDNPQYSASPYVPYALYRLALLSERLGREENLKEANQRIEDLVKTPAAAADPGLMFAARLRQGDIFRKLNDFPAAQRAYDYLVNHYAQRPDVVLAQLALADCHNIQASPPPGVPGDPSHADTAQLLFEQLRDRVDAPRDVRVEAGFKLGALLARRGRLDEAAKVWWSDVVAPFLVDDPKPAEPDAKSPYWLARTLTELGDLQEKRGRREEAKRAYLLLLEKQLPYGGAIARSRLEQMGVPVTRPGP
jgi:thioredoxin-like negative regulator of GroEL